MNKLTSKTLCGHCDLHFEGSMSMIPLHNCNIILERKRNLEIITGVKQIPVYHNGNIIFEPKY